MNNILLFFFNFLFFSAFGHNPKGKILDHNEVPDFGAYLSNLSTELHTHSGASSRSQEKEGGYNFIPLFPNYSGDFALNWLRKKLKRAENLLYLSDRPFNEDNSIAVEGYTIVDFNFQ